MPPAVLGRFLPAWHGIGSGRARRADAGAVLEAIERLAGAPVPASALETLVLPGRVPGYSPALLDELTVGRRGGLGRGRDGGQRRRLAGARARRVGAAAAARAGRADHDAAARGGAHRACRGRRHVLPHAQRPGRRGARRASGRRRRPGRRALGPRLGGPGQQRHAGAAARGDLGRRRRPAARGAPADHRDGIELGGRPRRRAGTVRGRTRRCARARRASGRGGAGGLGGGFGYGPADTVPAVRCRRVQSAACLARRRRVRRGYPGAAGTGAGRGGRPCRRVPGRPTVSGRWSLLPERYGLPGGHVPGADGAGGAARRPTRERSPCGRTRSR